MREDLINREEAVKLAGMEAVDVLDEENCECTNIVGYNGACQGDDFTEWAAETNIKIDREDAILRAYYYTTNEQDRAMEDADGDGSIIDWEVAGYVIF